MRLISRDAGRVTLLFPLEEVTPMGGASPAEMIEQTCDRYAFRRRPNLDASREDIGKNGLVFGIGQYYDDVIGEVSPIAEFSVFTDGVVANATSTDRAEAFLVDVIAWLQREFGFREFSSEPKKIYVSQLVIEFDNPLSRLISGFDHISSIISAGVAKTYNTDATMDASRIDFEIDKIAAGNQIIPRFIIERRVGVPFSNERYFSGAPMTSSAHIDALEEIERLLAESF